MTPEHQKCAVREAPQRCPLLDNGLLGTFPQQRVGLWKPKRFYEINTFLWRCGFKETDLVWNTFSMSTNKQQTFSMVTGDYISGLAEKKAFILRS
jgi:hypothetical protein